MSEHFDLYPVAEGVYAAIATETGAGFSNTGLIDLGDRTLAFDAFENPQAAEDLLEASLRLTGRSPSVVILSHWHPDHWAGMQVFAGCAILSTPATRQAAIPIAEEMWKDRQDPSRMEQELEALESQLAAEGEPARQRFLRAAIARQRHSLRALPSLEPTLPNQTFEGRIVFHGTRRSAELIATGRGHTEGDCVLRLVGDRAAFVGDLGFFQSQPFMPHGSPPEWLALLEEMAGWDVETFVPGHGPLGTRADLALEAEYIRTLEDVVGRVVRAGGTVEEALARTLPPPFDAWQVVGRRFEANVRASYERQVANSQLD